MLSKSLTPSLLTFCFVKDSFDRTGDLMLGLAPIFLPIAAAFEGDRFDPKEFAGAVHNYYGITMPVAVAEEFAIRLAKIGLLRSVGEDNYVREYYYLDAYKNVEQPNDGARAEIAALIEHARRELSALYPNEQNFPIEQSILDLLVSLNFSTNNFDLELKGVSINHEKEGHTPIAAALHIIVADYIYRAKELSPSKFEQLRNICAGAMLAQVILTVKSPPQKGIQARSLTVYFDTPLLLQYFGFEGSEKQQAASELIVALRKLNATWGCYRANVDEMTRLLNAVLEAIATKGRAEYEVGRHVTASGPLRTRARELLSNADSILKRSGFRITDPATFSAGVQSAVPERFELGLTGKIRPSGWIESREVDSAAVCDTVRQRHDRRVSDFLKANAIFVSPNRALVAVATRELRASALLLESEIPYVLSDAQLGTLLWIAVGSDGEGIPTSTLLANCVTALGSNQAAVDRMREIVETLGPEEAAQFEAIIGEDRCAYYLTKLTASGSVLLTKETGVEVFEQLKRQVASDVEAEAAARYEKLISEKEEAHRSELTNTSEQLKAEIERLHAQRTEEAEARDSLAKRLSEIDARMKVIDEDKQREKAEKDRANDALISLCRVHRRRVEFYWALALACFLGLAAAGAAWLLGAESWRGALSLVVAVLCGAMGFYSVPNYVFGSFVESRGEAAFLSKARQFGVAALGEAILSSEKEQQAKRSK